MTRRSMTVGRDRFIVGPWHERPDIAYLSVAPSVHTLTNPNSVVRCVQSLLESGYNGAVTAALRGNDAHVFASAGFDERERLLVLRHDLDDLVDLDPEHATLIRRARRRDRPAVLAVDDRAFESFWSLGEDGLSEALTATASVRFRVLETTGVRGYAVTGRSGEIGYLQRLAVDPEATARGFGTALVLDSLHWLKRRRGRNMFVNTQQSNAPALALYQRLGFRVIDEHLTVMQWPAR
ncbi:MAG: GNAT family N-acetyltransferase [Actinobacteria bacterium]|nr:GNAT family N-acetyltransferase [Actinomycetota bacterium]